MKRAAVALSVIVAVAAVVVFGSGAANGPSHNTSYKIELDNAFGLVTGADFKISGVPAGTITAINLDQKTLNAVVTVSVTTPGVPDFRSSATCDSEPQSLIGEYFITCEPGTTGARLANGATIPVTHTTSTIPADLVLDILQVPERERLPLIINSLGAGLAARSGDLGQALDRALPALRDTDQLLALLDSDSDTLKSLTVNADDVVTALADNGTQIQRFIDYANRAAVDTAPQSANLKATLARLPGFLTQLGPNLTQLGEASAANTPELVTLNQHASQLHTLFSALPGFSASATPAITALGRASVTGTAALTAAKPVVRELNTFSTHVPELAKNLSIVLPDLDTQSRATERNPRSPGGKGYSGLEALLQFAFNLAAATNYYGPTGHMLGVDGFVSAMCTPYATQATVAASLKTYGSAYRSCYAWLGPNQPGVNETDPSDPTACVPDPGGEPTGQTMTIATSACKLSDRSPAFASTKPTASGSGADKATEPTAGGRSTTAPAATATTPASTASGLSKVTTTASQTVAGVAQTVASLGSSTLKSLLGYLASTPSPSKTSSTPTSTTASSTSTTQALFNYLLGQ